MQENILSKKLNLGLNFSTPSGGVTSPSLKGSMVLGILVTLYLISGIKSALLIMKTHLPLLLYSVHHDALLYMMHKE